MRQSARLVFNQIMVVNYVVFFNCTPVGRASDSLMARHKATHFRSMGPVHDPPGFNWYFSLAPDFQ